VIRQLPKKYKAAVGQASPPGDHPGTMLTV
jgi:hypothetical protein